MNRRIVPLGLDLETYQLVTWEEGDELVPVPIDLFGRVPTAQPQTLFSSKHRFSASPLQWISDLVTGGTITHTPNQSAVTLAVTTASGSKVTWQTRRAVPYQAGKEQGIFMTWVLSGFDLDRRFRMGQFDDQNGLFLQVTGATPDLSLVIRDYVQGSVRDTVIDRVDWNIDPLDGTGPSKLVFGTGSPDSFDITKVQIFTINYQWLAAGTVVFGFSIDGVSVPVHKQHHANKIDRVYMSTAILPIRFEIENTAATDVVGNIVQICTEVHSAGGESLLEAEGVPHSASNHVEGSVTGLTLNNNNVRQLIAIRLKTTFGGVRNSIVLAELSPWLNSIARNIWLGLLWTPSEEISTETGGTWTSVNANSGMEFNIGITALTPSANSYYLYRNTIDASSVLSETKELLAGVPLALNIAGTRSGVIYMLVQRLEANNTSVFGGFNWKEIH